MGVLEGKLGSGKLGSGPVFELNQFILLILIPPKLERQS